MGDLRELYQEVILDHGKKPRNFGKLEKADHCADGHNPLCGDKLTVYLKIKDGVVDDASFEGSGCAISTASASMMTQFVKGKTVDEVKNLFECFRSIVMGKTELSDELCRVGKLAVFAGVSEFPVRVKCATLAWHTLTAAIDGKPVTSTE